MGSAGRRSGLRRPSSPGGIPSPGAGGWGKVGPCPVHCSRSSFTPLVVPAKKDLYKAAVRQVLGRYAEILTEKFSVVRSGEKPGEGNVAAQQKPVDNTTITQVREKARAENDTTPVTTNELKAAIEQAKKEGKFRLAVDYYSELIKHDPQEALYYIERGAVQMNHLKDYKSAIKDFDATLKLRPNLTEAVYNRGSAFLQLQDLLALPPQQFDERR